MIVPLFSKKTTQKAKKLTRPKKDKKVSDIAELYSIVNNHFSIPIAKSFPIWKYQV